MGFPTSFLEIAKRINKLMNLKKFKIGLFAYCFSYLIFCKVFPNVSLQYNNFFVKERRNNVLLIKNLSIGKVV